MYEPYARLGLGIIAQAVNDAKAGKLAEKLDALTWLTGRDAENLMDYLSVNPGTVRKWAAGVLLESIISLVEKPTSDEKRHTHIK